MEHHLSTAGRICWARAKGCVTLRLMGSHYDIRVMTSPALGDFPTASRSARHNLCTVRGYQELNWADLLLNIEASRPWSLHP
jgi:hypothetical protein